LVLESRTTLKRQGVRTSQEKTMARTLQNAVKRGLGVLVAALFTATAAQAADVVVGSKIDTEGGILGNVIVQVLESHGLTVQNRVGLGATPINRKALLAGEIDIYPEYTGNAAFFFNKADDSLWKDAAKGYAEAKKLDYDANKVVWLNPAPANNTWAIALRSEVAEANKLKSLSDFG
jgi:osmoprotectant transport system substrate-binding protein